MEDVFPYLNLQAPYHHSLDQNQRGGSGRFGQRYQQEYVPRPQQSMPNCAASPSQQSMLPSFHEFCKQARVDDASTASTASSFADTGSPGSSYGYGWTTVNDGSSSYLVESSGSEKESGHYRARPYVYDSEDRQASLFARAKRKHKMQSGFLPHVAEYALVCPYQTCRKPFKNEHWFNKHVAIKHGPLASGNGDRDRAGGQNTVPCKKQGCDKAFASVANMLRHHKLKHDGFRYTCDICNKSFARLYSKNLHLAKHKEQRREN